MMNYEEFKNKFVAELREKMSAKYEIEEHAVMKCNGVLDGITLRSQNTNVGPTIYCQDAFKKYEDISDFDDVVSFYADLLEENDMAPYMAVKEELVSLDKVCYRVINTKKNEEWLKDLPHRSFLDLSIIYYVATDFPLEGEGRATITVTNALCESFCFAEEELWEAAKINTRKIYGYDVRSIEDVLKGMGISEDYFIPKFETPMYVVSSKDMINGSAAILEDDILQGIADKFADDVIIFPSSLHEIICVPAATTDVQTALIMVTEVNENEVEEKDFLADSVYRYDRETHETSLIASRNMVEDK